MIGDPFCRFEFNLTNLYLNEFKVFCMTSITYLRKQCQANYPKVGGVPNYIIAKQPIEHI